MINMNPHNPTTQEVHQFQDQFFSQMKRKTKQAVNPWMHSFDLQFSDQWMVSP
ncbi:MAG: hypothetical protein OXR66_09565 [Candidatus Woesearchaeota archaeon]|nr:hypothetical protein [Candidatus Woesearchaeota archaeon]